MPEAPVAESPVEVSPVKDFEKLGAFYMGRQYDLENRHRLEDLILYDSKDLTTHAMCVGMTGSGKTGLCLALLEEAAIDGIPAIAIDPKGDLGNLFLTFPELQPGDFLPWIDESSAAREGVTPEQFAERTANTWRAGLAEWGQAPERIAKFRDSVELSIYTPGSTAGLPLTVLRSFNAPPLEILDDADAFRERVSAAASGLLALVGVDTDPVRSREHILVSNVLARAWQQGRSLEIADMIREIQSPPFAKVGVVDLDTFFPEKDRIGLAMTLNNLLASPSFAGWLEGEPLDVKRLLYTAEGKPRLTVISIAHLSDPERMFFVTILLNEILAWIRTQPGTSSLRALLYMDEVYGYFPPTANPPSKTPMLTLLKQARAFGLGVVLATQNPVDLDYKGLSNMGTWFLGRLQTERDKARVLDGLEGASLQAGSAFDRSSMEKLLAALGSRVFLMNNVHEDAPVVFQTRWVLSYLRGPLTRSHIQTLMADRKNGIQVADPAKALPRPRRAQPKPPADLPSAASDTPVLPTGVLQRYLPVQRTLASGDELIYRPALLGQAKVHFSRATYKVDVWKERSLLTLLDDEQDHSVWEDADAVSEEELELDDQPQGAARFSESGPPLTRKKSYTSWTSQLKNHLYANETVSVWKCAQLKELSQPGEAEVDFRIRLSQKARELRDEAVEKLRKRYASKFASLEGKIRTAEARVAREKSQYQGAAIDTAVSFGSTILGALFGRKLASRTNVSRAATSARGVGRTARQRDDVGRAEEELQQLKYQMADLEAELAEEIDAKVRAYRVDALELEELAIRPRKTDTQVDELSVVWTPWVANGEGVVEPAHELCGG